MTVALVQSATQVNITASNTTAPTITRTGCTAGNHLVGILGLFDDATGWTLGTVTDGTTTHTVRSATATAGTWRVRACVSYGVISASGDKTLTWNLGSTSAGSNRYGVLGLWEFSGLDNAALEIAWDGNDQVDTNTDDISAGPTSSLSSQSDGLVVGVGLVNEANSNLGFGSPSGFTSTYRQNDANTYLGVDGAYRLGAISAGTLTMQWSHGSIDSGSLGCGVVVVLKSAAVVSGGVRKQPASAGMQNMSAGMQMKDFNSLRGNANASLRATKRHQSYPACQAFGFERINRRWTHRPNERILRPEYSYDRR